MGIVESIEGDDAPHLSVGMLLCALTPGISVPLKLKPAWRSRQGKTAAGLDSQITVQDRCSEMVVEDLKIAKRHALLKANGFDIPVSIEN